MASQWKVCECNELGCEQENYQDTFTGEDHTGKAWSVPLFKKHLQAISNTKKKNQKNMVEEQVPRHVGPITVECSGFFVISYPGNFLITNKQENGQPRGETSNICWSSSQAEGSGSKEKALRDGHSIMETEFFTVNSF